MKINYIVAIATLALAFCVSASPSEAAITMAAVNSSGVEARITPEPGDRLGVQDLYLGAVYNGLLYIRGQDDSSWHVHTTGSPFPVAGQVNMTGGRSVVRVTNLDVSALVGLEMYVAYGVSESDALNTPGHLERIYTVPPSSISANSGFTHYGFYYRDYSRQNNDLSELATYTSTTFANTAEQVQLARSYGFTDIFYELKLEEILTELLVNEGVVVTDNSVATYDFNAIAGYEAKALELYRRRLVSTRGRLMSAGVLDHVELFYLADEPAIHRNYIPSQAFLNGIEDTFKEVFPDKKSAMTFAEDRLSVDSFRGTHFSPPQTLDILGVDPYFWDNISTGCSRDEIRRNLYVENANSTIDWALQFNKPIIVVGDAMLRSGIDPLPCYIDGVYEVLKDDQRIIGLIWFIYDSVPLGGGLSGAANSPTLIGTIKNLTVH